MTASPTSVAGTELPTGRRLGRQLGKQGAMLFSGFAAAQMCSFVRNALVGHALSRGDFGIAATITMALQMLDTLSDLGADRLLVQASQEGEDTRLMAVAHTTLLVRGIVTSALLFIGAGHIAAFFGIAAAGPAFELAALVPLIRSLMHLDSRRRQRRLQNRDFLLVEIVPQAAAVLAIVPCLYLTHDYMAIVWVAIFQALLSVVASHLLATEPYAVSGDRRYLGQVISFGWPIWLSAFPLVVVYQGDRILVGRLLGMDALAGYSAAFLIAMVPGLLAAKVAHALCLPLLSAARTNTAVFTQRYLLMFETASVAAAAYVVAFVVAGGDVMPQAFGPHYVGLGAVISCLAAMWALRMMQSICGMALMARGETRPLLIAGIIRASGVALNWLAIEFGLGLTGVAAAGVVGELVAIAYVLVRTGSGMPGIARRTAMRALYPLLAGAVAATCVWVWPVTGSLWMSLPIGMMLCASAVLAGLAAMPEVRLFIETQIGGGPGAATDADGHPPTEAGYAASRA